ncbi:MAG: aminopeptidase P family protein [Cytophagaceae bacterium]|jgi:Xaa-Pro aminopeptidase|nr:aminopeptidase P family protein [Cytophagaceae bacterium]
MNLDEKLSILRLKMKEAGIDACIIPSGDPHLSEYSADHWKIREWVSGFTGSAGTVVITACEAGLWTDSRYYLQAEQQLNGKYIRLFKDGQPGVPDYADWLNDTLPKGSKIGVNNELFSITQAKKLTEKLGTNKKEVISNFTMDGEIWNIRPPMPVEKITSIPDYMTGLSRQAKIEQVRNEMRKKGATHYITAALDEIAWVLNLRGNDVLYNPVFYAFLTITIDETHLYVNPDKLSAHIAKKITDDGAKMYLYEQFYHSIKNIPENSMVLIDPNRTNMAIYEALPCKTMKLETDSIITWLKAVKNETEIENIKQVMVKDGIAVVRFLAWLNRTAGVEEITELSAAAELKMARGQQSGFVGESFTTISAYGAHGAIVHYSATTESNSELHPSGVYLVDSGGQYISGTTDITRTVALGEVPEQAKIDYTLVLKGHIALANAVFPAGTRGVHLDILARKALWEHGLNYGHGTGHGVGYFLNVHEGPQSIRPQDNGVELKAGMVTSNEPGIYRSGEYGIRIENLILCVEKEETPFGKFLGFETLTLCPFDHNMIKPEMLTNDEKGWINNYHRRVYEILAPLIVCEAQVWLKKFTQPIE